MITGDRRWLRRQTSLEWFVFNHKSSEGGEGKACNKGRWNPSADSERMALRSWGTWCCQALVKHEHVHAVLQLLGVLKMNLELRQAAWFWLLLAWKTQNKQWNPSDQKWTGMYVFPVGRGTAYPEWHVTFWLVHSLSWVLRWISHEEVSLGGDSRA